MPRPTEPAPPPGPGSGDGSPARSAEPATTDGGDLLHPVVDPPVQPAVDAPVDLVRARRQVVAKWTRRANRLGYLLFGAAIITFVLGFFLGFNGAVATLVIAGLIAGSVLLAPAIVLGYAVKAAERDDREHGR